MTDKNFNPANYKPRLISASVILLIVVVSILLRQISEATTYLFDILIGFMMIMGAFEIESLLKNSGKPAYIVGMGVFPIISFIALIVCISYETTFLTYLAVEIGLLVLTFLLLWLIIASFMPEFCAKQMSEDGFIGNKWCYVARRSMNTIIGCIYPTFLLSFVFLINHFASFYPQNSVDVGLLGLVLLFVTTMAADTSAMLTGRFLKTKKINLEKLGPGKTWGGFFGGILGSIIGALLVFVCFNANQGYAEAFVQNGINVWIFLVIGLFCGLFNMFGDISASFIKRRAGIKDFGTMIPGHGGIMDRINGLVFNCLIVFIIILSIFGA